MQNLQGQDGQPFRNFGPRVECKMCRLSKGVCFKGKVEQRVLSVSARPTLAERQLLQQKDSDLSRKPARVAMLEARLQKQETKLHHARVRNQGQGSEVVEMIAAEAPAFEHTVAQLHRQRKLLGS